MSSWIKSIELCTLKGSNPVILTEYPISLDDSTANVEYIQEKLSSEAFNGEKVKLMNVKNIAIADTEATRGLYNHCRDIGFLAGRGKRLILGSFPGISVVQFGFLCVSSHKTSTSILFLT